MKEDYSEYLSKLEAKLSKAFNTKMEVVEHHSTNVNYYNIQIRTYKSIKEGEIMNFLENEWEYVFSWKSDWQLNVFYVMFSIQPHRLKAIIRRGRLNLLIT